MKTYHKCRLGLVAVYIIIFSLLLNACITIEMPKENENLGAPQEELPPEQIEEPPMEPPPEPEDPQQEPPPEHDEPPAEPPPQEPEPQEPDPHTDLEITDIYPGNLPQGNLFVSITNNGPLILMTAPVELNCHANGKRLANQPGEDNHVNTVMLVVQIGPGDTTDEDTGITIDANLYEYFVECSITSDLDSTPNNNAYAENIP